MELLQSLVLALLLASGGVSHHAVARYAPVLVQAATQQRVTLNVLMCTYDEDDHFRVDYKCGGTLKGIECKHCTWQAWLSAGPYWGYLLKIVQQAHRITCTHFLDEVPRKRPCREQCADYMEKIV